MRNLIIIGLLIFSTSANAYVVRGSDLSTWMKEYDKAETQSIDVKIDYLDVGNFAGFIFRVYDACEQNNIICQRDGVTRG